MERVYLRAHPHAVKDVIHELVTHQAGAHCQTEAKSLQSEQFNNNGVQTAKLRDNLQFQQNEIITAFKHTIRLL